MATFKRRHIGVSLKDQQSMLKSLGFKEKDQFLAQVTPDSLLTTQPFDLPQAKSEQEFLSYAKNIFNKNKLFKNYIGMGYYNTYTPPVILRNILENPGWYTAYTPYQAEISQGRMEALVNFQTMVMDLTGMEVANSSLLDESTAIAEAISMAKAVNRKNKSQTVFLDQDLFPQNLEVATARNQARGFETITGNLEEINWDSAPFAIVVQYPNKLGEIHNYQELSEKAHQAGSLVIASTDLLALTLITPPGEWGADIVVGSTQRFGVPLGYGGPHAAFLATKDNYKRSIPGRIIGVSKDSKGRKAFRLALQTREQHIRREKATSNICTAQVLLAVISSMYAVYHGAEGLKSIAQKTNQMAQSLLFALKNSGFKAKTQNYFDTFFVEVTAGEKKSILKRSQKLQINLCTTYDHLLGVSLDETTTLEDIETIYQAFTGDNQPSLSLIDDTLSFSNDFIRQSSYLTHPVFKKHQSETELLRYLKQLENKDLSLTHSMIPLGSCTMKLNATAEMIPVTWPEVSQLHPFAPLDQAQGYREVILQLEAWLSELSGFHGTSLQPNAGSQGEYAGLLVIKKYLEEKSEGHRHICLIPSSAHGTNPASAVMAGFKVVVVQCDSSGNIDLEDLKEKAQTHSTDLAALMITYPSTHGVFEETLSEICQIVHDNGGQVYMDGANFNAMVGLARPGELGPDVMHMNLHKTFCIPHGGGGPGVGPISVAKHLTPFLPGHSLQKEVNKEKPIPAISAAPWGSASILPISWAYIAMMGSEGLTEASVQSILSANYIAKKLENHYPVLYTNPQGFVAHECIIDTRPLKEEFNITVDDIAKRLMDYGFHAPTMSWPVVGTLMIEPTESESLEEIDRFCHAMISIKEEILKIKSGDYTKEDNPLKNAPHALEDLIVTEWSHPYTRETAAYPQTWLKQNKFWPSVSRVDNAFGDKNFFCSCSIEDFT